MLDNNFEKNVQYEMQGFKIKPSEEVWLKVEERIRKKKKRRFFFILFFFGGLALLGYWQRHLLFSENKIPDSGPGITVNQQKIETDPVKTNTTDFSNKQSIVKENREINQPAIVSTGKITASEKKKIIISVNKKEETENREIFTGVTKQEKNKFQIVQAKPKREAPEKSPVYSDRKIKAVKTEEKNIADNYFPDTMADINVEKRVDQVIVNKADSGTIQKTGQSVDLIAENKLIVDSIKNNKPVSDTIAAPGNLVLKSEKWKWGVYVTPGVSSLIENMFLIDGAKSADFNSAPGGAGNIPPARPSYSSYGFAFQAGGFVQRKLTEKKIFSLGLQYSFYTDRITVGNNRDTILRYSNLLSALQDANFVYGAAAATKNFINRYHFIELPLNFKFQINKNSSHPFYLNMGIAAGQLISARALVYDTAFGGIYHNSRKRLNKTQFSLSAGVDWNFLSIGKARLSIGPLLNLHLNRMLNNPMDRNKYLFFTGIRTAILFPGNK